MNASKSNPVYSVYIVDGNTKYDITPTIISIELSDQKGQIAQRANITAINVQIGGSWLAGLLKVRQRVFIYADDGEKNDEVFRGFVWSRQYKSSLEARDITISCYDNLIYMQESEDYEYFSSGKSTKDVISSICSKWGIPLEYAYESITHDKLPLRGDLSNILTSDILDLVQDRTGKKYIIRSEKDTMKVLTVGANSTVYRLIYGQNTIQTYSECTMEGMTTKVIILGKAGEDDRSPIEATITQNSEQYGTMQKVINRTESTTLADAKKEAQNILNKNSSPKWEYETRGVNVPWIRKGDKVYINAGDIADQELIAVNIDRTIDAKGSTMTLTLERP